MMKKIWTTLLLVLLCLSLCACTPKGNIRDVQLELGTSSAHSRKHIQAAMDVVLADFEAKMDGCTLIRLWYDEIFSEKDTNGPHWKLQYQADEVIVLQGDFRTGNYDANVLKSLSPNETYTDFGWVVCRYGNEWVIQTRGYA